jgi:hypothetical protein
MYTKNGSRVLNVLIINTLLIITVTDNRLVSLKFLQSAVLGFATSTSLIRTAATLLETNQVGASDWSSSLWLQSETPGETPNIQNNFQFS